MPNLFVSVLVLFLCLAIVDGRIESLKGRTVEEGSSLSNKIVFLTAQDSLIGSETPKMSINQTISLKQSETAESLSSMSKLTVLFFSVLQSSRIGHITDVGMLQLCCNQELVNEGTCDTVGEVIIKVAEDDEDSEPLILQKTFSNPEDSWTIDQTWTIQTSGVYELLYVNCEDSKLGEVQITGTIEYTNPFGQLSAEAYPLLWFFGLITFVLILVGTVWTVIMLIHRNHLISLQTFLSVLLVLEFVESFTWFLMLWVSNRTGTVHWLWLTATVLTSSVKRTSVGLLVLLISLGYGIMNKAQIGSNRRLIAVVIGFYFAVSTGQELVTTYIREGVVASDFEVLLGFISLVLLFPAVIIPLGLFWWICACLTKTIQKLKLRQQQAKLDLYNKILITLLVCAIMTGLMILMQTGISLVESDQVWRVWWLFTAFWFMIFFGITLSLLVLLHPAKNEKWLAYSKAETMSLATEEDFSSNIEIELDEIESNLDINFDFDLGFDENIVEEASKLA